MWKNPSTRDRRRERVDEGNPVYFFVRDGQVGTDIEVSASNVKKIKALGNGKSLRVRGGYGETLDVTRNGNTFSFKSPSEGGTGTMTLDDMNEGRIVESSLVSKDDLDPNVAKKVSNVMRNINSMTSNIRGMYNPPKSTIEKAIGKCPELVRYIKAVDELKASHGPLARIAKNYL